MRAWLALLPIAVACAAEPSREALAAFSEHAATAGQRVERELRDGPFLFVDAPDAETLRGRARMGETVFDPSFRGKVVPGGLLHHRRAVAFAAGATLAEAIAVARDYDSFARIYEPTVIKSRLVDRSGDDARFLLQIQRRKAGLSATLNVDHALSFIPIDARRAASRVRATRIAEVAAAGTRAERELPPAENRGFLWALESFWRFLERDGGVYIQVEALSLSRSLPFGLQWLFGSFIEAGHQEFLERMVSGTRTALLNRAGR
jgi:hypothetical protein